jgi:hypothetical protein
MEDDITHGIWMFLRTYLLERGFLEVLDGFMIAVLNARGSFLKWAKYWEMEAFKGSPREL